MPTFARDSERRLRAAASAKAGRFVAARFGWQAGTRRPFASLNRVELSRLLRQGVRRWRSPPRGVDQLARILQADAAISRQHSGGRRSCEGERRGWTADILEVLTC